MNSPLVRAIVRGSLVVALAAPFILVPARDVVAQDRAGERGTRGMQDGRGARGVQPRGPRGDRGDRGDRGGGRFGGGPGGMFNGMMRPGWERRDLQLLDRELDLDPDQETIIEILMADYLDGFSAEGERIREEMQSANPFGQVDEETRDRFREMRRDMVEIRERLRAAGNDEATREQVSAELQARIAEIREEARAMRPTEEQRAESSNRMASLLTEWDRLRRQLDAAFRSEMTLVLTEPQIEKLPAVEIDIRRARLLPTGRLAGESIDLTQVAREAGVEVQDTVDPILETLWPEYEVELDSALVARDLHLGTMGAVMMDAFRTQDPSLAIEASRTEAALREAVRDVNLRYHLMATALLGESGVEAGTVAAYDETFRQTAFRRIYGPTFAQRSFVAAAGLEDLRPSVRETIADMEAAYAAEIEGLNQLLERELIASEGDGIPARIERFAARMQGEDSDRPDPDERLDELFERRQEIDEQFRTQLDSLLTPDQIAQLPETRAARLERRRAENAERRAEFMERFDRDGDGELSGEERRAAGEAMRRGGGGRVGGVRGPRGGGGRDRDDA